MRDFIVVPPVEQDEEAEYIIVLPTHKKLAIQARQSKKRQAMYNKESYEYQTKVMYQRAIKIGWSDEDITLLIENKRKDGKLVDASGTLRIDQRPTMQDLWGYIGSDEYGAVMTRAVDRLFRHFNMVEPAQFAEHCMKHDVIVLTEHQRFDFNRRPGDVKRFLEEAQKGADYIREHIGMMQRYKHEKSLRGEYDGRSIPTGYILDSEGIHFLVYEPHACVVRWIFFRFRELSGNVAALYKELAALPYVFPFFPEEMHIAHMALGHNEKGYTITPRGLRDLLCNTSYIGWWLVYDYEREYVDREDGSVGRKVTEKTLRAKLEHNHPAIVDEVDFWFAYDLLNQPVEEGERHTRSHFTRKGTISCEALLDGIVTSDGKSRVYVNQNAQEPEKAVYTIYTPTEYGGNNTHGSLYVRTLDRIFTTHLFEKLEEGKRLRALVKDTELEDELDYLEDNLATHFIDAAQSAQVRSIDLEKKLKDYREEAASLEHTLHYGAKKLPGETVEKFAEDLAKLHVSIQQLELKKKRAERAQAELQEFVEKLDDIPGAWKKMGILKQRRFINLITDKITLTKPAPNWLLLTITWSFYDEWHNATSSLFYIWQRRGNGETWTEEEKDVLRGMYPGTDRASILEALPRRNWLAITNQAYELGVERAYQYNNCRLPKYLSLYDAEFMECEGLVLEAPDQRVWYKEAVEDKDSWSRPDS